ncbi:hypothetical protein BAY59_27220 [Prauserella coralliicola]|nr:hypothetical protein BAY59_27220 [Prauserella coralliicola]
MSTAAPHASTTLITGGARGIGAACAQRAVERGDIVVVWDRAEPVRPIDGVRYERLDVRDAEGVEAAAARHTSLGLVVNAAGITGFGAADELDPRVWADVLETNLHAPFLVARAVFGALRRAGGSLVNIGSITAHVPGRGRVAYCTSKTGVLMLTRVLALEWADHGIRVNSVSPGYTRTRMVVDAIERGHLDEERILRRTPQRRMAEPEEIAAAVFALTGPAFGHVTGQELVVDGGWSANGAY